MFQDGSDEELNTPASRARSWDGIPRGRTPARFVPRPPQRHRRGATPRSCPAAAAHADQRPALSGGPAPLRGGRSTSNRGAPAASIRFPPSNFKHFLTLFSKSFSSFPRGTCSLSVSCRYLALDGIYHPLRAAFPNSPTRRQPLVERRTPDTHGVLTLWDVPFQGTWVRRAAEEASPDYNSRCETPRFSSWALSGSLAVTREILVSFFSSA